MTTTGSLNQSMERAVQHYSSLFKLPSYRKMVLLQALICTGIGSLSTVLFPSYEGFIKGFLLGISLFLVCLIADHTTNILVLKQEPIYDLRRITGLSLFSWGLWLLFSIVGVAVAGIFGFPWWVKFCLFGFSAVMILRSIVLFSTSSAGYGRLITAVLLQPFMCIIPFLIFWTGVGFSFSYFMLLFLLLSPIMSLFASLTLVSILDNVGKKTLGISSMLLFKAFLLNWTADLNNPFEEFLEKLGENRDVEVCLIQFSSSKPKAVIVVPSIHPGPFKNVGSSLLPSMLKAALEKRLGCVVCVPHGLFGHEFDLSSQTQSQKVIDRVVELANLEVSESRATPFVKVTDGLATACCQVFGNLAFVSFTLSPKTTEDLPQELGSFVRNESERHALKHSVVVDAHNSIDGTADTQKALEALEKVTVSCLEKVASMKPSIFEVGAATLIPKEFDIKQGMGPGGITTVIVKAGKQKTAYVVIDGNNMVSGLRENILSCLHSLQFDEGEVFTTDTHSVNAVILGNRGYHPVGEVMSHETLIGHIKSAVLAALSNLEPVKVAYSSVVVPSVKVIGGKQLERLCLLIDRTLEKAKKVIVPILALSSLPLMLVLTQM